VPIHRAPSASGQKSLMRAEPVLAGSPITGKSTLEQFSQRFSSSMNLENPPSSKNGSYASR
jgi:hypothetical protein